MEQKFQRGFRVLILSRLSLAGAGENYAVGEEAIIEYSNLERRETVFGQRNIPYYSLFILSSERGGYSIKWYEEDFLELICCNAAKGEKILKENRR